MEAKEGCYLSGTGPCETAFRSLATAVRNNLIKQCGAQGSVIFNEYATLVQQCNNPASNAGCIAQRGIIDQQTYLLDVKEKIIDPNTGFPKQAVKCPSGFILDPTTEKCIIPPNPPPPVCQPGYYFNLVSYVPNPTQKLPPPTTCACTHA